MLFRMIVVGALVLHCGFTPVEDARSVDAAVADAGEPDAGSVNWCAPSQGACLADGWSYDTPGRCCLSRQTCKGRVPDSGVMGSCAY
jgi:hypothetical protein